MKEKANVLKIEYTLLAKIFSVMIQKIYITNLFYDTIFSHNRWKKTLREEEVIDGEYIQKWIV